MYSRHEIVKRDNPVSIDVSASLPWTHCPLLTYVRAGCTGIGSPYGCGCPTTELGESRGMVLIL